MKIKIAVVCLLSLLFQNCDFEEKENPNPEIFLDKKKNQPEEENPINYKKLNIALTPSEESYRSVCEKIKKGKKDQDHLSTFFENSLVNQIIPYWYGTPWDFNGYTNEPDKGEVACGYFVSTTLKHMGFNLNRYQLAQQSPVYEALTLAMGEPIVEIRESSFEKCFEKMEELLTDGIYFIGLAHSHVGFLLNRKGQLIFIHSSYGQPAEVVIEPAISSSILKSFNQFFIAELSNNERLMSAWKNKKQIKVITKNTRKNM